MHRIGQKVPSGQNAPSVATRYLSWPYLVKLLASALTGSDFASLGAVSTYPPHQFLLLVVAGLPLSIFSGCKSDSTQRDLVHPDGASSPTKADASNLPIAVSGKRVIVISIDGMHEVDLERYVTAQPTSTFAALLKTGVRYTSASTPFPSDSFPGQIALHTGGLPRTTGVYYDLSYDRSLSSVADCSKIGAVVDFTELADIDSTADDGGGGLDVMRLPRDPAKRCSPVFPHNYLRVNTTFEVVKASGKRTAWLDKHLTYEVIQGPSGSGIDDLWNPEVASKVNKTLDGAVAYDNRKVTALLAQIAGKDHTGTTTVGVPTLFGMNFQGVSIAQKTIGAAYLDAKATPSAALQTAFEKTDASLGKLVLALKSAGLWDSTTMFITAAHGQSPIDPSIRKTVSPSAMATAIEEVKKGVLAHLTSDSVALVWLTDPAMTGAVAKKIMEKGEALGVEAILSGDALKSEFGDPATDTRAPDLVVKLKPGILYSEKDNKAGEHGGHSEDDRHVLLVVSGGGIKAGTVKDPVGIQQVAPTVLASLGLDPGKLDAVRVDKTAVLPGIVREP